MIEGRPHILVVGGADTGRAPLLAALLRKEFRGTASVASAGVLAHAGEPADPSAHLACEQLGLELGNHVARHLDEQATQGADLLLAVDRGTARVANMRGSRQAVALGELAGADDVPDTHRMPLGVWISTARAYQTQIETALPAIRGMLKLDRAAAAEPAPPLAPPAAPGPVPASPAADNARGDDLQRITRLLETARVLPEIVDWSKVVQETCERLRGLDVDGPGDLTPGAAAMLGGILLQTPRTPGHDELGLLLRIVERLDRPVDAAALAEMAAVVGQWRF